MKIKKVRKGEVEDADPESVDLEEVDEFLWDDIKKRIKQILKESAEYRRIDKERTMGPCENDNSLDPFTYGCEGAKNLKKDQEPPRCC